MKLFNSRNKLIVTTCLSLFIQVQSSYALPIDFVNPITFQDTEEERAKVDRYITSCFYKDNSFMNESGTNYSVQMSAEFRVFKKLVEGSREYQKSKTPNKKGFWDKTKDYLRNDNSQKPDAIDEELLNMVIDAYCKTDNDTTKCTNTCTYTRIERAYLEQLKQLNNIVQQHKASQDRIKNGL
jgi:hypothetical protein